MWVGVRIPEQEKLLPLHSKEGLATATKTNLNLKINVKKDAGGVRPASVARDACGQRSAPAPYMDPPGEARRLFLNEQERKLASAVYPVSGKHSLPAIMDFGSFGTLSRRRSSYRTPEGPPGSPKAESAPFFAIKRSFSLRSQVCSEGEKDARLC